MQSNYGLPVDARTLRYLLAQQVKLWVVAAHSPVTEIKPGAVIKFHRQDDEQDQVSRRVRACRNWNTPEEALEVEPIERISPDENREQILARLRSGCSAAGAGRG